MSERKHAIENLNVKIKNRDKLIDELSERKNYYKEMSRQQRATIEDQEEIFTKIIKLTEGNTYNNEKAILGKIKELAQTAIKY